LDLKIFSIENKKSNFIYRISTREDDKKLPLKNDQFKMCSISPDPSNLGICDKDTLSLRILGSPFVIH
jgi:hypothetical protein